MLDAFSPLLAFLAGVLSVLSPCVLPLVPIVLGSAQSRHRFGPLSLGAGLALSFTVIGLFVATVGFSIGLDGDLFRRVGGALLAFFGIVFIVPAPQTALAGATGSVGRWASGKMDRLEDRGWQGQAVLGGLLGLVWVPCVGPTLGAASLLAAKGESLGQVAFVMAAFGVGAATPLVMIGLASGSAMVRLKGRLGRFGRGGKQILGASLLALGLLILTDLDRSMEIFLTEASPDWLIELTTRF